MVANTDRVKVVSYMEKYADYVFRAVLIITLRIFRLVLETQRLAG